MDTKFLEARDLIAKAREAVRRGEKQSAWELGEQAALLAPDMEDAWLILAASDPDPNEALAYARKALEINPSSRRAHKGVEWAMRQLQQAQASPEAPFSPLKIDPESPQPKAKSNNRKLIYAALFFGLLTCAVLAFAAYSAVTHPAFASILNSVAVPTQENLWAPVKIAKPLVTPVKGSVFAPQAAATPTVKPTRVPPTSVPKLNPGEIPTEVESATTPEITETPGTMVIEIVPDTLMGESMVPLSSALLPSIASSGNGARWIDVDLTNQRVYAYEGDVVVNAFIVSTGTWLTPTVTGEYKIYVKYRSAKMSGPGYYLPDVPYIMYFYKSYGLHGTYWHNNFGTPMSHGCVNLATDDAGWLYNWASVGTLVNVHY